MFIKLVRVLSLIIFIACGCHHHDDKTLRVGTIAGPETALMAVAKQVAQDRFGLTVNIVTFSDYNTPNEALADGSLDANMFQHVPYLNAQIKARGYHLAVVGKMFIYPMGIYSKHVTQLAQLPMQAKIAIPNDPSNEARALLLLQKAKLIRLKSGVLANATPFDIVSNPKQFHITALDAAELPRALNDVDLAVINTNYAIPAGLSPAKDALLTEGRDSLYANVVVTRVNNQNDPRISQLMQSLHSKPVLDAAKQIFGDGAIPAWQSSR